MVRSGLSACRLNFSHGAHVDHLEKIELIRSIAKKEGVHLPIVQDLQGMKLRLSAFDGEVSLKKHQKVKLSSSKKDVDLPVAYRGFAKLVKKGAEILLKDGRIKLRVTSVRAGVVYAVVIEGGSVVAHQGINVPGMSADGAFTQKDKIDLEFGLKHKVDWVALSFVSSANIVRAVKKFIGTHKSRGGYSPKLMVKVERADALKNIESILHEVDGIMIARGDLGIEIPFEEVPIVQKDLIELAQSKGKLAIVATEMLASMEENSRATRAEVSDVANAVLDKADAVMLSGETAMGDYPVESIMTMRRVIDETETSHLDERLCQFGAQDALAQSVEALLFSDTIDAAVSAAGSASFSLLQSVGRADLPHYVICKADYMARQYSLYSNVRPVVLKAYKTSFKLQAKSALKKEKLISVKDKLLFLEDGRTGEVTLTIDR
jgi:pyruvate kinase